LNPIKKLAGQTAIYGFSSIVPRLLNYFLTPLYTYILLPDEYGVITDLYAYVVFLNILLTYGMETTFMRFAQSNKEKEKVYSTAFISIFSSTIFFIIISLLAINNISKALNYYGKEQYILFFIFIIAFDTLATIPFVKLRLEEKAFRFATYKILIIIVNIFLNVFALKGLPYINKIYLHNTLNLSHEILLNYIFIANLISSFISIILLSNELFKVKWTYNWDLHKKMLIYALPLMIAGFAGSINEAMDRMFIKYLTPESMNPMY